MDEIDEKLLKKQFLYIFFVKSVPSYSQAIVEEIYKTTSQLLDDVFNYFDETIEIKTGEQSNCYCEEYCENAELEEKHIILCKIKSYLFNIICKKLNREPWLNYTFKEFTETDFDLKNDEFLEKLHNVFKRYAEKDINNVECYIITKTQNEMKQEINELRMENLKIKNDLEKLKISMNLMVNILEMQVKIS